MWRPLVLLVLAQPDAGAPRAVERAQKVLALAAGGVNGSGELKAGRGVERLRALDALMKRLTPATAAELERTVLVQSEAGWNAGWARCFWDGARSSRLPFHEGEQLHRLLDAGVVRPDDESVWALNRVSDPRLSADEHDRLLGLARAYERRLDAGVR